MFISIEDIIALIIQKKVGSDFKTHLHIWRYFILPSSADIFLTSDSFESNISIHKPVP